MLRHTDKNRKKETRDLTPMVKQYHDIKKRHRDKILLFRLGDFYEMFEDDAYEASKILDLVLTSRKGMPMCGFPHHAANQYISRLIKAGKKVAICEQLEEPSKGKKLVRRDVVQIITPGTITDPDMLDSRTNNYLMAVSKVGDEFAFAIVDLSTGEFISSPLYEEEWQEKIESIVSKFSPAEVLIPASLSKIDSVVKTIKQSTNALITVYPDVFFSPEVGEDIVKNSFSGTFETHRSPAVLSVIGGIFKYIEETQKTSTPNITRIQKYSETEFMILDSSAIKNLELVENLREGTKKFTLLSVLDRTFTPMGSRLLRKWILHPLKNPEKIRRRLEAVDSLVRDETVRRNLSAVLKRVKDIDRLISKVALKRANPKDIALLRDSLKWVEELRGIVLTIPELQSQADRMADLTDLVNFLDSSISPDPPSSFGEGEIIKEGFSAELDEMRNSEKNAKEWIANYQAKERRRLGIQSLKVGYNKVMGYYIEITKPNLHLVPKEYIRKQTLVNAERFTTPELEQYEAQIAEAKEKVEELERKLFSGILETLMKRINELIETSKAVAEIDVFLSLALSAVENGYTMPEVNEEDEIKIVEGRHPVVEVYSDEPFVPNDLNLNLSDRRLLIITGPNMAGKSTYLRQNALIVIMAQMGSFVPAEKAQIGIVDRIFTRIGASDNIAGGESTFMIEMKETAEILKNATRKSLVVMDEVGRGTSTYDGLSLAWAIMEYIHEKIGCRTLFATHYHELTALGEKDGIINLNMAVSESEGDVVFLRKVVPGSADKSYGIYVAKLAGIPKEVIDKATEILEDLEREGEKVRDMVEKGLKPTKPESHQFSLFAPTESEAKVIAKLKKIQPDKLTPLKALEVLYELKEIIE